MTESIIVWTGFAFWAIAAAAAVSAAAVVVRFALEGIWSYCRDLMYYAQGGHLRRLEDLVDDWSWGRKEASEVMPIVRAKIKMAMRHADEKS